MIDGLPEVTVETLTNDADLDDLFQLHDGDERCGHLRSVIAHLLHGERVAAAQVWNECAQGCAGYQRLRREVGVK